jgi:hypothetical protein
MNSSSSLSYNDRVNQAAIEKVNEPLLTHNEIINLLNTGVIEFLYYFVPDNTFINSGDRSKSAANKKRELICTQLVSEYNKDHFLYKNSGPLIIKAAFSKFLHLTAAEEEQLRKLGALRGQDSQKTIDNFFHKEALLDFIRMHLKEEYAVTHLALFTAFIDNIYKFIEINTCSIELEKEIAKYDSKTGKIIVADQGNPPRSSTDLLISGIRRDIQTNINAIQSLKSSTTKSNEMTQAISRIFGYIDKAATEYKTMNEKKHSFKHQAKILAQEKEMEAMQLSYRTQLAQKDKQLHDQIQGLENSKNLITQQNKLLEEQDTKISLLTANIKELHICITKADQTAATETLAHLNEKKMLSRNIATLQTQVETLESQAHSQPILTQEDEEKVPDPIINNNPSLPYVELLKTKIELENAHIERDEAKKVHIYPVTTLNLMISILLIAGSSFMLPVVAIGLVKLSLTGYAIIMSGWAALAMGIGIQAYKNYTTNQELDNSINASKRNKQAVEEELNRTNDPTLNIIITPSATRLLTDPASMATSITSGIGLLSHRPLSSLTPATAGNSSNHYNSSLKK